VRIFILAVGQIRGTPEGKLCDTYLERARSLSRRLGIALIEVVEIPTSRLREVRSRIAEEWQKLASRIPGAAQVIVLDCRGKPMTSEAFAELLASERGKGSQTLAFVIGGPDGLDNAQLPRNARMLAFGAATWPHLLVRVMLAEQIYRAATILAGHPYHRG